MCALSPHGGAKGSTTGGNALALGPSARPTKPQRAPLTRCGGRRKLVCTTGTRRRRLRPALRGSWFAVRPLLLFAAATAAVLLSMTHTAEGNLLHPFAISLKKNEVECFYEDLAPSDSWLLGYEVESGSTFKVKAEILGPDGSSLFSETADAGRVTAVARVAGEHKLCFHNTVSGDTTLVSFNIIKNPVKILEKFTPAHGSATVFTFAEYRVVEVRNKIGEVTVALDEYGLRVRRQFYLAEALDSRMTKAALAKLAAIVVWSLAQVYSIKRLFNQPSPAAYMSIRKGSIVR